MSDELKPSSDEVEAAFAYITPHPENHSAISLSADKLRAHGDTLRAHIATQDEKIKELKADADAWRLTCKMYVAVAEDKEADNKRLREALQMVSDTRNQQTDDHTIGVMRGIARAAIAQSAERQVNHER